MESGTIKNTRWKRGIFQCAYRLFSGKDQVGELKPSLMTLSAKGRVNDNRYQFRSRELSHGAQIINLDTQEMVGKIKFSHWLPKATIEYNGQIYKWSLSNLWETRWKISSTEGHVYHYKGWSGSGRVESELPADLLTLAGLYIGNYYWQMSAIYVAAFLPIIAFL